LRRDCRAMACAPGIRPVRWRDNGQFAEDEDSSALAGALIARYIYIAYSEGT